MKKIISILALALVAGTVLAQDVTLGRRALGSGTPGLEGVEAYTRWSNDADLIYHGPQYLPGYPTAASVWPRVVDVPCTKNAAGKLSCDGFDWQPRMGRGEYLFARPVLVAAPEPKVIVTEKVVKVEVPKIIEVPKIVEIPCCHHKEIKE